MIAFSQHISKASTNISNISPDIMVNEVRCICQTDFKSVKVWWI